MAGGAPPGNKNAQSHREFRDSLRRVLAREGDVRKGIDKIAEKLVACAQRGESWAIQELANRLDGKPQQDSNVHVTSGGLLEALTAFKPDPAEVAGAGTGDLRQGSSGSDANPAAAGSGPPTSLNS